MGPLTKIDPEMQRSLASAFAMAEGRAEDDVTDEDMRLASVALDHVQAADPTWMANLLRSWCVDEVTAQLDTSHGESHWRYTWTDRSPDRMVIVVPTEDEWHETQPLRWNGPDGGGRYVDDEVSA